MGDAYIRWLADLSKKDLLLAGGKGANLGEIFNAKFPVPQAFVVTTDSFNLFLSSTKLKENIREILNRIDVDDTGDLQARSKEIRDLIIETKMPEKLEEEILESYDHFNVDLDELKGSPGALAILKSAREPIFVSVRSSATAEDLKDASFAGQQESFINVKGNHDLIEKVKRVFASIFTARSIYYRKKKGFEDFVPIAAIVQKMINSEKSGVMFSKHPVKGTDEVLIEAVYGQGEGIVSGKIKPDQHTLTRDMEVVDEKISDKKVAIIRTASGDTKTVELKPEVSTKRVLKTHELKQLAEYAIKLEEHYKVPQDIEFSIEDNEIFILQTRPITTLKKQTESQDIDGEILTQGLAASPGVASGVVKIIKSMDDLSKIKKGDVLVTTMTNPDMVMTMEKSAAIVTSEGGITAHAAIVSREMGIPAVVGAQNALEVLEDGMEITVDGFHGKVFSGKAENKSVEILPIVKTKTHIKVMVDLPKFAERAAKTQADGVGLVRLEGLIASSGKHPLAHEKNGTLDEYESMLKEGLREIAGKFIGKPIWIRSSDIRSDEYANLEGAPEKIEKNPMLGDHGIRFSLKHEGIFRAELRAIKILCDDGHKFGVMFPQIISLEEVRAAKKIFEEEGCSEKVQFGVMIETPAASWLIKDICEEKIDFISFGTNDLTQYTLAIDRGNEDVQYLFDEMNWAVLKQLSRVIRECKKHKVLTSICGQAGSNPEMVKYLVKQGIDSISVNADVAKPISELVARLEAGEDVDLEAEKKAKEEGEAVPAKEDSPLGAPQGTELGGEADVESEEEEKNKGYESINENQEAQAEKLVQNEEETEAKAEVNKSHAPEMEEVKEVNEEPPKMEEKKEISEGTLIREIGRVLQGDDILDVEEEIEMDPAGGPRDSSEPSEGKNQESERHDEEPAEGEENIQAKAVEEGV